MFRITLFIYDVLILIYFSYIVIMNTETSYPVLCMTVKKISYGLGHVFNDFCAAMWFSYTLFYLQVVIQLESTIAGTLLMIGR